MRKQTSDNGISGKASANVDSEVMLLWRRKLVVYPEWQFGGTNYHLEEYGDNAYTFNATFKSYDQAYNAVQVIKNC